MLNPFVGSEDCGHIACGMVDHGQIGLQLMDLYGKLRRATDAQVRRSLEARIDELVALYEREQRAALDRPRFEKKERPRAKR
jgi:hypothetical protein